MSKKHPHKRKLKQPADTVAPSTAEQTPVARFWGSLTAPIRRNPRASAAAAGTVAALVGSALFNRARATRAEAETPPAGTFIEVDGVRLHYVDRGQGRPVVLLHGNGAMVQDWMASGVLDAAAAGYRVIAFDRPGFGHSDRPRTTVWTPAAQAALIHKALVRLGITKPIVVGHSWGTLVALAMALDFPRDVAALVLMSGYYYPTARPDVPVAALPAVPLFGDVMRMTVSPVVGRLATPLMKKAIFAPLPVPSSFDGFPMEMSLRPSQIRATAADTAMMIPAAALLSARYGELALPVVLIAGDGDTIAFFDRHSERLHDALPGSDLQTVEGAGHMFHYSAPEAVIAAIDRAAERSAPIELPSGGFARGEDIIPLTEEASF
jgi:pimeloyl-ACP methyl ester carboxylesterase